MAVIPRRILTEPVVLTSGMGWDENGELTYTGSTLVSGSGYLKTSHEYQVTPAGILTFDRVEVLTDPEEMNPKPGDKIETHARTFRVGPVRPIADRDGVCVVNIADVQEITP